MAVKNTLYYSHPVHFCKTNYSIFHSFCFVACRFKAPLKRAWYQPFRIALNQGTGRCLLKTQTACPRLHTHEHTHFPRTCLTAAMLISRRLLTYRTFCELLSYNPFCCSRIWCFILDCVQFNLNTSWAVSASVSSARIMWLITTLITVVVLCTRDRAAGGHVDTLVLWMAFLSVCSTVKQQHTAGLHPYIYFHLHGGLGGWGQGGDAMEVWRGASKSHSLDRTTSIQ